jgi:hypothetical protein
MKKISKNLAISLIGVSILFNGCFSDPKEANNENFSKAVNQYLSSDKQKLNCININFMFTDDKKLNNLEEQGFLQSKIKKVVKSNGVFGFIPGAKKLYVDKKVYEITKNAKPFYKNNQICIGKVKLEEILSFTPPTKVYKYTISEVKYSYSIVDLPSWTNIKNTVKTKKHTFKLTNNGWEF